MLAHLIRKTTACAARMGAQGAPAGHWSRLPAECRSLTQAGFQTAGKQSRARLSAYLLGHSCHSRFSACMLTASAVCALESSVSTCVTKAWHTSAMFRCMAAWTWAQLTSDCVVHCCCEWQRDHTTRKSAAPRTMLPQHRSAPICYAHVGKGPLELGDKVVVMVVAHIHRFNAQ